MCPLCLLLLRQRLHPDGRGVRHERVDRLARLQQQLGLLQPVAGHPPRLAPQLVHVLEGQQQVAAVQTVPANKIFILFFAFPFSLSFRR